MGLEYQKEVADKHRQDRQDQLNADQLETNKVSRMAYDEQIETNRVSRIAYDDQLRTNRISRRNLKWTLIVVIFATLLSVFSVLSQVFGWLA